MKRGEGEDIIDIPLPGYNVLFNLLLPVQVHDVLHDFGPSVELHQTESALERLHVRVHGHNVSV